MVAFQWNGPERNNTDVYVKQIGRDTAPIRITDHAYFDGEATWSPDGEQLAFLRDENGDVSWYGRFSIYVAPRSAATRPRSSTSRAAGLRRCAARNCGVVAQLSVSALQRETVGKYAGADRAA